MSKKVKEKGKKKMQRMVLFETTNSQQRPGGAMYKVDVNKTNVKVRGGIFMQIDCALWPSQCHFR